MKDILTGGYAFDSRVNRTTSLTADREWHHVLHEVH